VLHNIDYAFFAKRPILLNATARRQDTFLVCSPFNRASRPPHEVFLQQPYFVVNLDLFCITFSGFRRFQDLFPFTENRVRRSCCCVFRRLFRVGKNLLSLRASPCKFASQSRSELFKPSSKRYLKTCKRKNSLRVDWGGWGSDAATESHVARVCTFCITCLRRRIGKHTTPLNSLCVKLFQNPHFPFCCFFSPTGRKVGKAPHAGGSSFYAFYSLDMANSLKYVT
jgi:hypothetical protein